MATKHSLKNILTALSLASLATLATGSNYRSFAEGESDASPTGPFFVKPYLQLGNNPHELAREKEEIHWFSKSPKGKWKVEIKSGDASKWKSFDKVKSFAVPAAGIKDLTHWCCEVSDLEPGEKFSYRVLSDNKNVFENSAVARKNSKQKSHIAIFGDCGARTDGQRKIAALAAQESPDLLVVPGDIAYNFGLFSDYVARFFPQYSNDTIDPKAGAPLMEKTIIIPALGNHDVAHPSGAEKIDLSRIPDALAYYYIWSTPHNGPANSKDDNFIPKVTGGEQLEDAFYKSAGDNYPVESNYSFDYGNAHWLILDANVYSDWSDKKMRDWVRSDLKSAKSSTWKFVMFHQPGFSIDREHSNEQRMRLLTDVFQDEGVDVVWAGHSHNYQRTKAFTFKPQVHDGVPFMNANGTVSGEFRINKDFDGVKDMNPQGIVYIVSGGGGAHLYNASKEEIERFPWLDKFVGDTHSFTVCDIDGDKLSVKQISEDGKVLDEFAISKAKVLVPAG